MNTVIVYPERKAGLMERLGALPDLRVLIANTLDELSARLPQAEMMVTSNRVYEREVANRVLEHGKRLRWIQFTTTGVDKAIRHGLPDGVSVTNAAGSAAQRVAEHGMSLLLAVVRKYGETSAARSRQIWLRDDVGPRTISLAGKTMLIVGLGAIGQDLARKAKAFDMRVVGISRSAEPLPNIDEIRPREDLLAAIAQSDVVALAATYDETTHHIIDAKAFAAMKPSGVLINVGRGRLVDEAAMIAALQGGKIFGAGLDVTWDEPLPSGNPLWSLPNLVLTPHIAAFGDDNTEALAAIFADNYARYRQEEPLAKWVHGPKIAVGAR